MSQSNDKELQARTRLAPVLDQKQRETLVAAARDAMAAWRNAAFDEYVRLCREFEEASMDASSIDRRTAQESLDIALSAIAPTRSRSCMRWMGWVVEQIRVSVTGTRPDEAWRGLHDASEAMVMLYDEKALRRQAPRLEAQIDHLDQDDQRLGEYRGLIDGLRGESATTDHDTRAKVRDMLEATHQASDGAQRNVRSLRNNLLLASAAVTTALVAIGIWHALNPHVASLCAARTPSLRENLCPTGEPAPSGSDVFAVSLMGVGGGLLSAIVPLIRAGRISDRYRMWIVQLVFKVAAGALCGFLGVLLLQGGLLVGLAPQRGSNVYAYGAFFGFAQQLLTGLVDRYAGGLAKPAAPTSPPGRSRSATG